MPNHKVSWPNPLPANQSLINPRCGYGVTQWDRQNKKHQNKDNLYIILYVYMCVRAYAIYTHAYISAYTYACTYMSELY